ncbi:hypothetical protein [Aestuariivirga sp.]|uniref:hypothetical protein n=1 Tax=Aestuariivirga sp. TaxID=2650926 RepID=UPI0025C6C01D|nr:hypothetical protein [Aestuariivirga sp.]MCA3554519.1 hypothetical protein [Aestuariivirga sp.]
MWQAIIGTALAAALAGLLARHAISAARRRKAEPDRLLSAAAAMLDEPRVSAGITAGTYVLTGRYKGRIAEVKVVADTLAVRKLPSLWLMVTMPGPFPVRATLDLMMRPAGFTSFSNFDDLPVTVSNPPDFPHDAVIRTDDAAHMPDPRILSRHLALFRGRHGKELLLTPKGLRVVLLAGEADRARYGVLRQADFGDVTIDPLMVTDSLDLLMAVRADVETSSAASS